MPFNHLYSVYGMPQSGIILYPSMIRRRMVSRHQGLPTWRRCSTILLFLLFLSPPSFCQTLSINNLTSKEFRKINCSIEDIGWLFERYVCGVATVDFAVKSISYYKETDLNTGASSYFTRVVVACNGEVKKPIELSLALEDGTVTDTVWSDSSRALTAWQTFEFKTNSAPEYAQLDPRNKIPSDNNYANNSLMVNDFLLPVVKWINRIFYFFQNILLSAGAFV